MTMVLSPSEVVMLRATDFVPTSRFGAHALGSPVNVNERQWMHATYRTATAAVVAAGDARLTVERSRRFFGLLPFRTVRIARTAERNAWPARSLEANLLAQVGDRPEGATLYDVYWQLIGTTVPGPTALALQVAHRGLVERGLLEAHEVRKLKVFVSVQVTVPMATQALATAAAVAPVQQLALAGGGIDPDTWKHVDRALTNAISARTMQSEYTPQ